ncbi:ATP-binding protein [Ramlibacter sp. CrO1]|uniref:ATP-binding protein n=1 Tax=Ramlibacter algicola TaxID=2795217 RepID=A0A934Q1A5_9BURK|nr:ATP-binding protein [Ramlibacter algicola]
MTVALVGAESTGKSTLSLQLAATLRGRGLRATAVPEVLRAWCGREGREPRPEEHLAIAQEQEAHVQAAALAHDVVIADTTALVVLAYSGIAFPDHPLHRFAVERQRAYGLTLLAGLDLPWVADGLHRDVATRELVDTQLRGLLQQHGIAYRVVYGQGDERQQQALVPVLEALGERRQPPPVRWQGVCEKCSDPDCEHRLFAMLRT